MRRRPSKEWGGNPAPARAFQQISDDDNEERVMGLFAKDIETMDDLLLHGLKDIYYAENQIIKSLPKLVEKATNRDLTKGLKDHLEETKNQVARLDQVFKKLGQEPKGVQCPAIDGLIQEADDVAGEVSDKDVLDAAIVGAAQAVEHYEIARYGTLIAWAESVGHDDIVRLLNTNLNEEKAADKKLSTVALRKGVNRKAAS
jgi:ferritin-like metal-binding protein YciE